MSDSAVRRMFDLTGKTAVVIGGTSGIGRTLANGLARAGADVIPTGRREALVEAAANEIRALGRRSMVATSDVTDKASLARLLDAVAKEFLSVEILVNCAGQTKRTPSVDVSEGEWNQILDTNLT